MNTSQFSECRAALVLVPPNESIILIQIFDLLVIRIIASLRRMSTSLRAE